MSIRSKILTLFLTVAAVAIVAFGVTAYYQAKEYLVRSAGQELVAVTESKVRDLRNIVSAWESTANQVASRTKLRQTVASYDQDPKESQQGTMRRILQDAVEATPDILSATIIGLDRRTVTSTDPSMLNLTWPSSAEMGPVKLFPGINVAQHARVVIPMLLDGRMLGHAVIIFDAWQIVDSVDSYSGLGETGETLLVSRFPGGEVTAIAPLRHDRDAAFNRKITLDGLYVPVINALEYDDIRLSEVVNDWRGVPVLAAAAHLPYMNWSVVVKIDYDEAIRYATDLRSQYLLMGIALLALAAVAGLFVSQLLSVPLKKLAAAAERVATGNLDENVEVTSKGEIGDFAAAFNRMTSELRNAHEIIKGSEEQHRSVVETSPDAIFIRTKNRIVFCNNAALSVFGYDCREDFIGLHPRETVHPDDLQAMRDADETFFTGDHTAHVVAQCRRIRSDGTVFFAEVSKAHIRWNNENAVLVCVRDLTERKRAEAAIWESEERYRQMAELSPDAIFVRDDKYIVYANSATADLYGYPDAASLVGIDPVDLVHPDDWDKVSEATRRTLSGNPPPMLEIRQVATDGTVFTTQSRRTQVTWNGKPAVLIAARDVTEQHRNARRLFESQERYRAISELSPDSIMIRSAENILYCNTAAAEMFGYTTPAELMQLHPNETVDIIDRDKILEIWQEIDEGELKSRVSTVTQRRKDGTTFITEARRSIIEWEGEKVLLVVGRDITERIEAEEKLNEAYAKLENSNAEVTASEAFFRAVIEQAADAIMIIDDRGNIEQVNPMAGDMFGYEADEMIGENIRMIMPPREAAQHDGHLKRYRETGKQKVIGVRREETGMTRDGREIPVEISTAEVSTPDRRRFLGIVRDISERVEAEEKLNEAYAKLEKSNAEVTASEAFFRAVIEQAADAIMIIDDRGTIEQVNPMAGDMFGYDAQQMIGENIRMIMPPREAAQHDGHLKRYRETGKKKVIGVRREETGMTRDGREIPVEISTAEVSTSDRRRFLGIVRDISERVESERKLQDMNDELTTINEEMRRFTYIVSHDLKAPLVNIRGFANELMGSFDQVRDAFGPLASGDGDELQRLFDQELTEDIPEALHFIDSSVGKMEGMIRSILKLSRVGRHEIAAEAVDITGPATETVAALGFMVEETGAEIVVGDLPAIVTDRDAISQILGNLVENALKYLSPDRKGRIEITGEAREDCVTISVRDNGRGIAADDVPKIFELFRRVGRNDVAGDGMGLTYTRAFVQRLGGTLTCESELGVGTTFILSFPDEQKAIAA